MSKVRIGIDVGGTFTDAVAVDYDTFELIGSVKVPTTHSAKESVAAGIVKALHKLMNEYNIDPTEIAFIAHGTTQATNALLEGDVAKVGILALGSGIEGNKTKVDTTIGDIPLTKGKSLRSVNTFVNTKNLDEFDKNVLTAYKELLEKGAESIVVSEAFSVDNPENENRAAQICIQYGAATTAGNEVSKLYGLKIRTRTAVINASIMPKMLDTANMTEQSIKDAGIESPLMIMRCDGGVMTVDEVRNRPIMTILSGPAAGVAGALMYEKLTDGLFLEVGGTSTDISCIKDGSVMVSYAEVGGHKTYLNSLDVRTVGIGGGSMVAVKDGKIVDMGPRSAHIAGLPYECYTPADKIVDPVLKTARPQEDDVEYAYVECADGGKYALTMSGAANICGYVSDDDYAVGNLEATRKAWTPLAESMHMSVEACARAAMEYAAKKNKSVVEAMIRDYALDKDTLVFCGGGGGASTVVPHLAQMLGVPFRLAKNASVISPIGVALAMVRDVVERICLKPSDEDLRSLRREALERAVAAGAAPESVTIKIEIDSQTNKIRAIATGTTELRRKELGSTQKTDEELAQIVAERLKVNAGQIVKEGYNGYYRAFAYDSVERKFIFKKKYHNVRLVDPTGVIRLQRKNATVRSFQAGTWKKTLNQLVEEFTVTNDGGDALPNFFIACGSKIVEIVGMQSVSQIYALAEVEIGALQPQETLVAVITLATENQRG